MGPLDLLKRLKVSSDALMQMGALEFATRGKPLAQLVAADVLTMLGHLQVAGHSTAQQVTLTSQQLSELERRIEALEKGEQKPIAAAVKAAIGGTNG